MLLRHDSAMDPDLFESLGGASEAPMAHASVDPLDDVWGAASTPSSPRLASTAPESHEHPSDIRRLQQEHATAGYRDGITVAKSTSVQDGFDEGFGLGATIGARVGQLLGLLEGVAGALRSADDQVATAAQSLFVEAEKELSVRTVFSAEYWEADGTWKYEVPGADETEAGAVFADVASAHPLVKKWDTVVKAEVERWGIDLAVLAVDHEDVRRESGPKQREVQVASRPKEALAW